MANKGLLPFPKTYFSGLLTGSSIVVLKPWEFPQLKSDTDPLSLPQHTKSMERLKKELATLDWQVVGLMRKRTYIQGFSWKATRQVDLHTHPQES